MQTEVKARHIPIKPSIILSEEKAKGTLDGILHDIKSSKASFASMAEKYSEDPGSAVQGGELGWSDPNVYVPEFRDMLGRLQPGQISEPFRTSHGWQYRAARGSPQPGRHRQGPGATRPTSSSSTAASPKSPRPGWMSCATKPTSRSNPIDGRQADEQRRIQGTPRHS